MPESVSSVDAILDGLRERATGWSCVPLADAVAAVHAAAEAAASPDERLREALTRANDDLILIADYSPSEVADAIDSVRAAIKDALAAAGRGENTDG